MATFTLEIDIENAAFDDDKGGEIARILDTVSEKLRGGADRNSGNLYDINGNRVGQWEIVRPASEPDPRVERDDEECR